MRVSFRSFVVTRIKITLYLLAGSLLYYMVIMATMGMVF